MCLCASVREGEPGEPEMRRMVRYPDAHQLFVGNVPHDVDKSELKEFFERKFRPFSGVAEKCPFGHAVLRH